MFIQAVIVTAATLTAAPQQTDHADRQSPDASIGIVQADAGAIAAPGAELLGPRPAAFIWAPAPASTAVGVSQPSPVMAPEGGRHVIAISTLSLVLGIIILVLLI